MREKKIFVLLSHWELVCYCSIANFDKYIPSRFLLLSHWLTLSYLVTHSPKEAWENGKMITNWVNRSWSTPLRLFCPRKKLGFVTRKNWGKYQTLFRLNKEEKKNNTIAKRQRWIPRHFCNSMPQTKCPRNVWCQVAPSPLSCQDAWLSGC